METVEACNEEKKFEELLATVLVVGHIRTLYDITFLQEILLKLHGQIFHPPYLALSSMPQLALMRSAPLFRESFSVITGMTIFHAMYQLAEA